MWRYKPRWPRPRWSFARVRAHARSTIGKRQVKSPKVYVRDSGLLHQLLGLDTEKARLSHPKLGASWEGFVMEQVLATEPHDEASFWATHQGAEIDLLLRRGDRFLGVECKRRTRKPGSTLATSRQDVVRCIT